MNIQSMRLSPLKTDFKPGLALRARDVNRMGKALGRMRGHNGITIYVASDGGYIISGPSWPGRMYYGGVATDGLNSDDTKRYVVCNLETGVWRQDAGPMPYPMPVNEEWFPKSELVQPVHLVGR